VSDGARQRVAPDPYHAGENLVEQIPPVNGSSARHTSRRFAVSGDGVFDTLKAVSKLVLKSLA
jgi:hypothetical protein